MTPVVYDAGALIAADRHDRAFWAEHRVRLEAGILPCVPSPIVAREIVPLDEAGAHRTGSLLGKAGTTDLADACLVDAAVSRGADVVTGDREDIERLASKLGVSVRVVDV